jgi:hypothetical protein
MSEFWLRADIDTAVNAISRFIPVYLAAFEFEPSALTAIAVLDRQDTTTQDPPLLDGTGRDATGSPHQAPSTIGARALSHDGAALPRSPVVLREFVHAFRPVKRQ